MKKLRYESSDSVNYKWDKIAFKKVLIKKNTLYHKYASGKSRKKYVYASKQQNFKNQDRN